MPWKGGFKTRFAAAQRNKPAKTGAVKNDATRKRGRPKVLLRPHTPFGAKLRKDFLKNECSAAQVQRLADAAESSGCAGVHELASASVGGWHRGNLSRDLGRRLLDEESFPPLYWARMEDGVEMPVMLPHEALRWYIEEVYSAPAHPTSGLSAQAGALHSTTCGKLSLDPDSTWAIALWGDAVPYSKKRSVFVLTMSLVNDPAGCRLPLLVVPMKIKSYIEPLLQCILWSARCMLVGVNPCCRHTGETWLRSDARRQAYQGLPLKKGVVLQLKGDWEYFKNVLGLPGWNTRSICWMCSATPRTFKNMAECQSVSSEDFFKRDGMNLSSLLSCPGISTASVVQDWLHTVDLGVGSSLVGALIWECIDCPGLLQGTSRASRLQDLWAEIQVWYKTSGASSRLGNLTLSMLRVKSQAAPFLHSKAAECRGLQAYLPILAAKLHAHVQSEHTQRILDLMIDFWALVQASTQEDTCDLEKAAGLARSVHAHLAALDEEERLAEPFFKTWECKPKLHQLLELVTKTQLVHGPANLYWTYMDESYGGKVAKRTVQRGGSNNVSKQAVKVFQRIYNLREFV